MSSSYEEFITAIKKQELTKQEYYRNIVRYRHEILLDIINTNQTVVAAKLNMHQTKLSAIAKVLGVIDDTIDIR